MFCRCFFLLLSINNIYFYCLVQLTPGVWEILCKHINMNMASYCYKNPICKLCKHTIISCECFCKSCKLPLHALQTAESKNSKCNCYCQQCRKRSSCKCQWNAERRHPYSVVHSKHVKKWFFTLLLARSKEVSVLKFYGKQYVALRKKCQCLGFNRWVAINSHISLTSYDALHDIFRNNYARAVIPGSSGCIDEVYIYI